MFFFCKKNTFFSTISFSGLPWPNPMILLLFWSIIRVFYETIFFECVWSKISPEISENPLQISQEIFRLQFVNEMTVVKWVNSDIISLQSCSWPCRWLLKCTGMSGLSWQLPVATLTLPNIDFYTKPATWLDTAENSNFNNYTPPYLLQPAAGEKIF